MGTSTKGTEPFDEAGLARHIDQALAVQQPTGPLLKLLYKLVRTLFNPTLIDTDKIPDKPCLFVSNHSLFALDGILLIPILHNEIHRFPRSMGDRFLWSNKTEKILLKSGCILGHPEVCNRMMENGMDLIVFPGGAHEAVKKTDQKYQLLWKQRYGFVRLAAQNGYTIVPLAQVGPDEFYSHLMEGEDIPDSMIGKLLKRAGLIDADTRADMFPPIPVGMMGSLMPKPQHCYYQFGDPIDLSQHRGKSLSQKKLHEIRTAVADQIETMIAGLLEKRATERGDEKLLRRLLTR